MTVTLTVEEGQGRNNSKGNADEPNYEIVSKHPAWCSLPGS